MNYYFSIFLAYLIGGITFLPIVVLCLYIYSSPKNMKKAISPSDVLENEFQKAKSEQGFHKAGWLQVTRDTKNTGKSSSFGGIVKSYLSGSPSPSSSSSTNLLVTKDKNTTTSALNSNDYFAVLKFNTLFLYDSELQLDCKDIIHTNQYTVRIYPEGLKDHELFSKANRIMLQKKKITKLNEQAYYIHCSRCIDKEDWYHTLLRASKYQLNNSLSESQNKSMRHSTDFDQNAMNHLISSIHSNPSQFEMQWFNALLGRIFLSIYKTEKTKNFFYNKILSKVDKLNARRPDFLEAISLRSVDGGHGAPQFTQPRLINLSPQGEYTGDVYLFYDGHFRVEFETVLRWTYSERLPPIRIDLVLAVTLTSIEGKMMLKLKSPPTNRIWLGFYKKPKMSWIVEPVVWEKRIGYAVVSKAIQTKIEDILTETLVLPNMDDLVFFNTDGVGGIFGEEEQKMPKPQYQSLPTLYASPSSQLIVEADVPLLSTVHSNSSHKKQKKQWFTKSISYRSESLDESVDDSDTPSQLSLKSIMINNNITKTKKKKKNNKSQRVVLGTNINHKFEENQLPNQSLRSDSDSIDDSSSHVSNPTHTYKKSLVENYEYLGPQLKTSPSTSISEVSIIQKL